MNVELKHPGQLIIDGKRISPARSQKIRNHSPDGFAWGYGGSGPSQLALAILLELTDEIFAALNYQDFKWEFIAPIDKNSDHIIACDILETWIKSMQS